MVSVSGWFGRGRYSILALGVLSACLTRHALAAAPVKTVCTITINSNQEKEVFRKSLPSSQFRFVELIPETAPGLAWIQGWAGADWFKKACERRIQCDVLLISGHFAGTFFGRSGQSLGLTQMEKASCQSSCDGIFKRPQEVYLFGCNTLADKTPDHRQPQDYEEVLRADGFSAQDAHAIALQRYTPWGASNLDRMRSLFPNAKGLYGFSSTSPLGKYIEAPLAKYLKTKAKTYAHDLDQMKPGDTNFALAKALAAFSFRQAQAPSHQPQSLVCQSSQEETSQLQTIQKQIESAEPLRDLSEVLQRFTELEKNNSSEWQDWKAQSSDLQQKFWMMFESKELAAHFVSKLGVLEFLWRVGADNIEARYQQLIQNEFQGLTAYKAQQICLQRHSALVRKMLLPSSFVESIVQGTKSKKSQTDFIFSALGCLKTQGQMASFQKMYPDSFLFTQDWTNAQPELLLALKTASKNGPKSRLRFLLPLLSIQPVASEALDVLKGQLQKVPTATKLLGQLRLVPDLSADVMQALIEGIRLQDETLRADWIQLWRGLKPESEKIQTALMSQAVELQDPSLWLAVVSDLNIHPQVTTRMKQQIQDPQAKDRRFIMNLLGRSSIEGSGLYSLSLKLLRDRDVEVRIEAVDILARFFWEVIDDKLEPEMLRLLKSETSAPLLDEVARFWAKRGTERVEVLEALDKVWQQEPETSGLRRTLSEVLTHLNVKDVDLVEQWFSRWQKAKGYSESENQLMMMLAQARWTEHPQRKDLLKGFRAHLNSENSQYKLFAIKALLRSGQASPEEIQIAVRELEVSLKAQNWMGARQLAFELENYQANLYVRKALQLYQKSLELTLDEAL